MTFILDNMLFILYNSFIHLATSFTILFIFYKRDENILSPCTPLTMTNGLIWMNWDLLQASESPGINTTSPKVLGEKTWESPLQIEIKLIKTPKFLLSNDPLLPESSVTSNPSGSDRGVGGLKAAAPTLINELNWLDHGSSCPTLEALSRHINAYQSRIIRAFFFDILTLVRFDPCS